MSYKKLFKGCKSNNRKAQKEFYKTFYPIILSISKTHYNMVNTDVIQDLFFDFYSSCINNTLDYEGDYSYKSICKWLTIKLELRYEK